MNTCRRCGHPALTVPHPEDHLHSFQYQEALNEYQQALGVLGPFGPVEGRHAVITGREQRPR